MKPTLAVMRKFLVAVLGAAASAVTLGVLHGTVAHDVTFLVAVATAVGVFAVPNDAPPAPKA